MSILVLAPVGWKRSQFYPNILTCEDGTFMFGENYNQGKEDITKFRHGISPVTESHPRKRSLREILDQRGSVVKKNVKAFFIGTAYEYGVFPGIPETFSLFLVPFLVVGCLVKRKSPSACFLILFAVLFIVLHVAAVDHYENRYYFPLLPFGYLFAFQGFSYLRSPRRKRLWLFIVVMVIACDVVPPFLSRTLEAILEARERQDAYPELVTLGRWIQTHTDSDKVFMSLPFFSSSFYLKRCTTFLPNADYRALRDYQQIYHHAYVFAMNHVRMGSRDIFPVLVPGKHLTLFLINEETLANVGTLYPEFLNVNPFGRVLRIPTEDNRFLQLHRILLFRFAQFWKGLSLYFAFIIIGVILFYYLPRRPIWGAIFLCGTSAILVGSALFGYGHISLPESMDTLMERKLGLSGCRWQGMTADIFNQAPEQISESLTRLDKRNLDRNGSGRVFLRIPIPIQKDEILNVDQAARAAEQSGRIRERILTIERLLEAKGYRAWALDSWLVAIRSAESKK